MEKLQSRVSEHQGTIQGADDAPAGPFHQASPTSLCSAGRRLSCPQLLPARLPRTLHVCSRDHGHSPHGAADRALSGGKSGVRSTASEESRGRKSCKTRREICLEVDTLPGNVHVLTIPSSAKKEFGKDVVLPSASLFSLSFSLSPSLPPSCSPFFGSWLEIHVILKSDLPPSKPRTLKGCGLGHEARWCVDGASGFH